MRLAAAATAIMAGAFLFSSAALAQVCPATSTQSSCACPTAGAGTTCFGGQLFRASDNDCVADSRPCSANQQYDCASESCTCNTAAFPCGGCTVASSTAGTACTSPTGGTYADECSSCSCGAGTTLCASSNKCVANMTCPAGSTWDVCSDSCLNPYVLISPSSQQSGFISVSGDLTTGGDAYLSDGKAIRVDGTGTTTLNVGNWGAGATGLAVDIYGTLTPSQMCFGTDCRTTWPGAADFDPLYVNVTGDTMTGTLNMTGTTTDLFVAGAVGIGTTTPSTRLDVAGTVSMTGLRLTNNPVAGDVLTSDGSGNGTWQPPAAVGGGGTIGGSGTTDYDAVFTASGTVGTGLLYESGSNVGIGTATPAYPLDVNGYIHAADGATIGGSSANLTGVNQNLIYGDVPYSQISPGNSLLLLQTNSGGTYTSRLAVDRDGDVAATGNVAAGGSVKAAGCFGATFAGLSSTPQQGNIGSYLLADAQCNAAYPGAHVCRVEEIIDSIQCSTASDPIRTLSGVHGWINGGPPGDAAKNANDCSGWTSIDTASNVAWGRVWIFNTSGGYGTLTTCATPMPFSCCR
jgi:hypothetical protein